MEIKNELNFTSTYEKRKYVYDALNSKEKSKEELAKEFNVTITRINEIYDNATQAIWRRTRNPELYKLLGNEESIITALTRGGIDFRKLREMYMKDSSLSKLREVKNIGEVAINKILKAMK